MQVLMRRLDSKKIDRSCRSQPEKSGDSFTAFWRGSCGLLQFSRTGPRPLQLGAAQRSITLASTQLINAYFFGIDFGVACELCDKLPCSVLTVTPCAYPQGRINKVASQLKKNKKKNREQGRRCWLFGPCSKYYHSGGKVRITK